MTRPCSVIRRAFPVLPITYGWRTPFIANCWKPSLTNLVDVNLGNIYHKKSAKMGVTETGKTILLNHDSVCIYPSP